MATSAASSISVDLLPAKTVVPDGRVCLHDLELFVGQRPRLLQDGVRHADLADVVQSACEAQFLGPAAILIELQRELGRQFADPRRVLARVGVAVLGDCRQPFERLVVLFFEILRASGDKLFELSGPNSQQFGLVVGRECVMRDLERLDSQVCVAVEDRFVDPCARLAVQQGLLVPPERLEHIGQQSVGNQLHVGEIALLSDGDSPLQNGDRVVIVTDGNVHPAASDEHSEHGHWLTARQLGSDTVEGLVGLIETSIRLGQQVKVCVRLGEVCEDLGDMLGKMLTGDLQRGLTEADCKQVLLALSANLGHVGEGDRVEAAPRTLRLASRAASYVTMARSVSRRLW